MDKDKILTPPPPEHDRSPDVANAGARPPRLPWIPPRFESSMIDLGIERQRQRGSSRIVRRRWKNRQAAEQALRKAHPESFGIRNPVIGRECNA